MNSEDFKVTIHMVSSLDGFIAKSDGTHSWLESSDVYEKGITLSDADIEEFTKKIDCYVMGSRTYERALELGWVYGNVRVFVLTSRDLPNEKQNVEFYSGDLRHLIENTLKPEYNNIWMAGGSVLAKAFLRESLADEIIVSILPIIIGDGLPFFDCVGQEQRLHLKDTTAYRDGMVELSYEIVHN